MLHRSLFSRHEATKGGRRTGNDRHNVLEHFKMGGLPTEKYLYLYWEAGGEESRFMERNEPKSRNLYGVERVDDLYG